jgi:MoaA/NifB/PqqE/SkfB family radical SAM enzyme
MSVADPFIPSELPDPTSPHAAAEINWPIDHPRAVNDVLALLDSTWLSPRTYARPTHYDIAVSVVCNIKCPFCPRQTFGDEIRSGLMKDKHYAPVVPHLDVSHRTGLYGLGEPFLNKSFFEFLSAAKAQHSYCMTSSHGMSLTSERIDQVLDSGLDELCVSMDGATPRTFNFLRSGADFNTVVANVSELIRRRNARGQKTPRVHIACAISKYNVWQLNAMVRLTKRLGADKLAFSNLVLDFPEHAHASIVGTRIFRFNLARARRLAEKINLECVFFYQIPFPWKEQPAPPVQAGVRYGCPSAWRQIIVERDGNLKPCCYLDTSLGNSAERPMEEQFNSATGMALRQTFVDGRYIEKCKGCGQFTQITAERTREIIAEASERIADGNFSAPVRAQLEHVLDHYRELAARA